MFGLAREEALSDIAFDQTIQQSNKQTKVQMPDIAPGAMRTVEFFILINSLDFFLSFCIKTKRKIKVMN